MYVRTCYFQRIDSYAPRVMPKFSAKTIRYVSKKLVL